MANDWELLATIKANAELVNEIMQGPSGIAFDFNTRSIEWVDHYLDRKRDQGVGDPRQRERLIRTFGSWYGQCIVELYGGEWEPDDNGLAVLIDERVVVYPLREVRRRLDRRDGPSLEERFLDIHRQLGPRRPKGRF